MNILVTGANGQLGNEMRVIAARGIAAQGDGFNTARCNEAGKGSRNYIFTDVVAP